jgi:aspartyl-tRNA(Asn)/glutamyl-tRNA(Gln) amidotransferase subunit C
MPDPLSADVVRHVAKLARLRLSDDELERYRSQLSTVLDHIAMLESVDVGDATPMAHPLEIVNRLADDVVGPALPAQTLPDGAPATEDQYIAVPKVLGDGS